MHVPWGELRHLRKSHPAPQRVGPYGANNQGGRARGVSEGGLQCASPVFRAEYVDEGCAPAFPTIPPSGGGKGWFSR